MLDSIYIGMSGLSSFTHGLRVISNNVTNLNTPGYKGAKLQFSDVYYPSADQGAGQGLDWRSGRGVTTLGTSLNFKQGDIQQTGNDLDVAVDGDGFFVLKSKDGETRYTKAGQFQLDDQGFLVNRTDGAYVQGLSSAGTLSDISLVGLRNMTPKATGTIKFNGNLSTTATADVVLDPVKVLDASGTEHLLKMTLKNTNGTTPGSWQVTLTDGGLTVGSGTFRFTPAGQVMPGFGSFSVTYVPAGGAAQLLNFELTPDATSLSMGTSSTFAVASSDGFSSGSLSKVSFDQAGTVVLTYTNGQSNKKQTLALAQFVTNNVLIPVGNNQFRVEDSRNVHYATSAKGFGTIKAGSIEVSNVDISQAFSELIITQRGYQAASHVVSTANEMIQQLFQMKGGR